MQEEESFDGNGSLLIIIQCNIHSRVMLFATIFGQPRSFRSIGDKPSEELLKKVDGIACGVIRSLKTREQALPFCKSDYIAMNISYVFFYGSESKQ
ncbi:interaptin-like isoform X3 [Gossypium australe]|uniref:Interaptin-like isoform X3 n=1 Tax=Gossypium australe TaxID=47621 RepID=A0A5B6UPB1_9ROSI|nr:interaptin-like isoform X3 [Gossypium australe]